MHGCHTEPVKQAAMQTFALQELYQRISGAGSWGKGQGERQTACNK